MILAARMIADAKPDAVFQVKDKRVENPEWQQCTPAAFIQNAMENYPFRVKPKSVMRLKPTWKILRDCPDQGWGMNPFFEAIEKNGYRFAISDLLRQQWMKASEIPSSSQMPTEWFEESED